MRVVLGALAFVTAFGVALAHAQATTPGQIVQPQQPQPSTTTPQRMPARPLRPGEAPPKGTAVIKGYVTAGGTGAPIRRATVTARSMEGMGGGVTNTDSEGRFEIKELPKGRYLVTASKGGYVTGQFGQRRPTDPGTPIDLADGQTAEKVSFILARGSVISGRIVDDGGEPVSGTQVTAMRYAFSAGARRLIPAGAEGSNDRTDDQGNYRLYGLPPGDYYVSASNRMGSMMIAPNMNSTETDGFAPTYFPGTTSVGEASRVTVRAGQEAQASFALIVARMARVRGRAMNSSGQPVSNAMLMLTPGDGAMMMMVMGGMSNAMVAPDGTFQFTNVPPGRYILQVRPNGMPTPTSEIAAMPVNIGSEDIENLVVVTAPAAIARGVVMTDDASVPPFRPDQVQLSAGPAEPTTLFNPGQNRINDDFTFELTGLYDRRIIRGGAGGLNSGWYLKTVLFDGTDITDTGMEFAAGRVYEGLQVIFTRKTTDLSGALTDDRGRPIVDASVVIFPADQSKWTYASRYVRTARPDTNGKYNFKSLPPGEDYLIIAVTNLESGQGSDPEFLTRAKEEAKSFSLNEGETKAVDIKLSKLVP